MKLFKTPVFILLALSSVFISGICQKFKKGVLEIQTIYDKALGGDVFYKAEIVDDGGNYTAGVEFNIPQTQNWKKQIGYYWPNKSANGLGYKSKDDPSVQPQTFSHKDGSKVPGKNGHWASTTPPVTGGGGGGGGGTSEIFNDVVTGNRKDRQYRTFTVPAGVKSMTVTTKETPPDAAWNECDLFVNEGTTKPSCNEDPFTGYIAKKASLSNNRQQDACTFANPTAGTWTVMLYNYSSGHYFSNLVVTITK